MPLPDVWFVSAPQKLLNLFTKFVLWSEALHPGALKNLFISFILPVCNESVKVAIVLAAVLELIQITVRGGFWYLVDKQDAVDWLEDFLPETITHIKSLIELWWPFLLDLEWWKTVPNHLWW